MANVHTIAERQTALDVPIIPPDPASDEIDLRELARKLWRRKGIIIGTTITLTVLAILVVFQLTPRFTSDSFVMINERESKVIDVEAVISGLSADAASIESEIQVIQSRGLAAKTIAELHLDQDPEFNAELLPPGAISELLDPRNYIPLEWIAVITGRSDEVALTEKEEADRQLARTVDLFLENLAVWPQGRSRVIKVAFTSENPKTAARVANQLADFYIVAQLEAKFEATQRASSWLGERLTDLRELVDQSERVVEQFRQQSGLIQGTESTLETQEISELNSQLVMERTKRAEADARLRQVERLLASTGGAEAVAEVLQSPLIERLREQQAELEREAAELSGELGDKHPKMINMHAEIEDLRQKIASEVNRIAQGLRNEVGVARAREGSLIAALNGLKQRIGRLNTSEVKLRALEREAEANRSLLETFLARSKETTSQKDFQQADATIISRADVPEEASFPKKEIWLPVSLMGALMVGILLGFTVEMLDHGFRSMEQIERQLGAGPLGLIPALRGVGRIGQKPETHILDKPASAYAEAIRSLHTSLLLSAASGPPKVVLVTSSLPKEGKTAVSLSLTHMLASTGHKVVLLDCDLRRPNAHKSFGVHSSPGLADCLLEKAPLEEVIVTHPKSGAHLIPAGAPIPNPADLLSSPQMKALLAKLAASYELVLLDSAPVLAVSDSRVLARLVDKTVFLVRWADTRRETAISGYRQIVDADGNLAGVALSMVDVKKHARYGYSDSGYYSGRIKKYYTG